MESNRISRAFGLVSSLLSYALVTPFFFAAFVLVYEPFHLVEFFDMGKGLYALNLTIIGCIIMAVMFIMRTIFHYIYQKRIVVEGWYIFWCCLEVVIISLFVSLYTWLMLHGEQTFFDLLKQNINYLGFILGLSYVIIGLTTRIYHRKDYQDTIKENNLVKFNDNGGSTRLVVPSQDLLFIEAKENYINICYIEKNKVKTYLLRNTMKSVEKIAPDHGLVRCHRSYFVNASRVKILRKDKDGIIYAEIDAPEALKVLVSKTYYEALSELL